MMNFMLFGLGLGLRNIEIATCSGDSCADPSALLSRWASPWKPPHADAETALPEVPTG